MKVLILKDQWFKEADLSTKALALLKHENFNIKTIIVPDSFDDSSIEQAVLDTRIEVLDIK